MARDMIARLSTERIESIVHSDMIRTRRLAERLGRRVGLAPHADPRWRERDFGVWEGRGWQSIWRETGDLMDRMSTDPETFRPGGGETGRELADRVASAYAALPATGTTLVIAHGGPIATLRALLDGGDIATAVRYIPACGEIVAID